MSKRNAQAVNYARHRMIDAVDLLSEVILTLQSKAGPGDPNTVTITISREQAEYWAAEDNEDGHLPYYSHMAEEMTNACRAALEAER